MSVTVRCIELRELGYSQADVEAEMRKNAAAFGLAAVAAKLPEDGVYRCAKLAHAYAVAGGWEREE
ncbi:MAG TPA: hypothetical protein VMZ50_11150 [Phycisphaerae bacterium]|nr:hypothetical protein [Phycisphaerae bacterium]